MNAATVLVIVLSNQGHWFGGQGGTVSVHWAAEARQPDTVLVWDLLHGDVQLAGDRVALARRKEPTTITVQLPEVRARVTMRWTYRVLTPDGRHELACGEKSVQVYPQNSLASLSTQMADARIIIWDDGSGLSEVLADARICHERIDEPSALQLIPADIVLVGPEAIGATPFVQAPLLHQAEAGASVLIFEQTRALALAGYRLARRKAPPKLVWDSEHPLLYGFRPDDLQSWLSGDTTALWAIELPANEAALEIVYWPRESAGREPVPIDALVAVKAIGAGRIVLCQVPPTNWSTDPRSQQLLANALCYMVRRPEPTPRPSERRIATQPASAPVQTITIPPGGTP